MSCSLQAMRDMHECELVLITSDSQFKAAHANNCISLFLVETSLYDLCNCILYCYVLQGGIDVLSFDK